MWRDTYEEIGVSLFLGSIMLFPLVTGCAAQGRVYVRTYGPAEAPYYNRWERDTRRDYTEYERRKKAAQDEYWRWRRITTTTDHITSARQSTKTQFASQS
jgi:hypothetical protein